MENGDKVPNHFHVTEIAQINKKYIDCGGTLRNDEFINFQLLIAGDIDHRLQAKKFLNIIEKSEKELKIGDFPIRVEYQGNTIENYDLEYENSKLVLKNRHTECLAGDSCGIPEDQLVQISSFN